VSLENITTTTVGRVARLSLFALRRQFDEVAA